MSLSAGLTLANFEKSGLRRSVKASKASMASGDCIMRPKWRASVMIDLRNVSAPACFMSALTVRKAAGGLSASSRAVARASANTSSSGRTRGDEAGVMANVCAEGFTQEQEFGSTLVPRHLRQE